MLQLPLVFSETQRGLQLLILILYQAQKIRMEMLIKVGPHGGGRGNQWDDRGQSTLTHIFVSYESEWINSIQTGYILGRKLQLSNKHGGNGDMFATVEIDYPSEFLTGINGYYGDDTKNDNEENDYAIKALTFETNVRKFGPFGEEKGTHFGIQMGTKGCFGGFHGSSDPDYLFSIGVYVNPINPLLETRSLTPNTVLKINEGGEKKRGNEGGEKKGKQSISASDKTGRNVKSPKICLISTKE